MVIIVISIRIPKAGRTENIRPGIRGGGKGWRLRQRLHQLPSLSALKPGEVSGLCRESGLLHDYVFARAAYTLRHNSVR